MSTFLPIRPRTVWPSAGNMWKCSGLPSRAQIGKQVEQLFATVRKNGPTGELEAALYASVVAPVESVVSAKARLTVIPDGPLYSLPFEMIGPRGGQRLLASHVVTYAPSGTVLTLLSEKNGPAASVPLLAVATGSDALAAVGANASDKQPFSKVNREVFDFGQPQLPPLPAANGEARAIAGILGGKSVTLPRRFCYGKRIEEASSRSISSTSLCRARVGEH